MLYDPRWPVAWFDWAQVRCIQGHHLPHLVQPNAVYFITFHLDDSMPLEVALRWRQERDQWLKDNPPPHTEEQEEILKKLYWTRVEHYLDRGVGSCVLASSEAQDAIEYVLHYSDGSDYRLGDYAVMSNHVHALVHIPDPDEMLPTCLRWKRISAKTINAQIDRAGTLWQEESFDHIMRSPEQLERSREYIRQNPRNITQGRFRLGCGSLFA